MKTKQDPPHLNHTQICCWRLNQSEGVNRVTENNQKNHIKYKLISITQWVNKSVGVKMWLHLSICRLSVWSQCGTEGSSSPGWTTEPCTHHRICAAQQKMMSAGFDTENIHYLLCRFTWQRRARGSLYSPWQMGHTSPASLHWLLVAAEPVCWDATTKQTPYHPCTLTGKLYHPKWHCWALTSPFRKIPMVFRRDVHWL